MEKRGVSGQGSVLVSDFDGTMTRHDFYKLAIESLLPPDTPDYWAEYRTGAITHFEALRLYFAAIRAALSIKEGYYTVLSSRDVLPEVEKILRQDHHLTRCFRD